jgi:dTMP kinase
MRELSGNGKRGRLVAFEGIDGSGKSTQIGRLAGRLSSLGIKHYKTREPTDSPIGSLIHQMMTGRVRGDDKVIASLFIADRLDHLLNETDGILSMVDSGISVITDRYYFSSYAYNGIDIDMDWVIHGNAISASILRPALTVFLDMPVKSAIERMGRERFRAERYETQERLSAVRAKYFEAFEKLKDVENTAIIDADADIQTVEARIWEAVSGYF